VAAEKVPSPFNSPLTKGMLAVFWAAYAFMLAALFVSDERGFLFIFVGWTIGLPWITWNFLSGVQMEPGKRVGGGPMYTRVDLLPGETILFNAPGHIDSSGVHLFVTDQRLIPLGIRLYGSPKPIALSSIQSVQPQLKGFGWPQPRESIVINTDGRRVILRPWDGPGFMGLMSKTEFASKLFHSLRQAGVSPDRFLALDS
jgi:hypothetical protein